MKKVKRVEPPDLDHLVPERTPVFVKVEAMAARYSLTPKECREFARRIGALHHIRNSNRIEGDYFDKEYHRYLKEGPDYRIPSEREYDKKMEALSERLKKDRENCTPNRKLVKVESLCKKYSISPQRCRSLARDAGAFVEVRRKTFVDKELFDKSYREMFKAERTREPNSVSAPVGKNYMRYPQAAEHFSMSMTCFKALAREAGAVRKIGNVALVNIDDVTNYIEGNCRRNK